MALAAATMCRRAVSAPQFRAMRSLTTAAAPCLRAQPLSCFSTAGACPATLPIGLPATPRRRFASAAAARDTDGGDTTAAGAGAADEAGSAAAAAKPSFTVTDVGGAGQLVGADGAGADEAHGFSKNASGVRTAWFVKKGIRGSIKKLMPLTRQIRGLSVAEAQAQLAFSRKARRGQVVRHAVRRAAMKGEFYLGLPPEQLVVQEAFLGKNERYPRVRYHAKGRAGRSYLQFTQLTVKVRAMTETEAKFKHRTFKSQDPDAPPVPPRVY